MPDDLQALDREEAVAAAANAEASKSESEEKSGVETGTDASKDDKDEAKENGDSEKNGHENENKDENVKDDLQKAKDLLESNGKNPLVYIHVFTALNSFCCFQVPKMERTAKRRTASERGEEMMTQAMGPVPKMKMTVRSAKHPTSPGKLLNDQLIMRFGTSYKFPC